MRSRPPLGELRAGEHHQGVDPLGEERVGRQGLALQVGHHPVRHDVPVGEDVAGARTRQQDGRPGRSALGCLFDAREVANAIVSTRSAASTGITGQGVAVTGGA